VANGECTLRLYGIYRAGSLEPRTFGVLIQSHDYTSIQKFQISFIEHDKEGQLPEMLLQSRTLMIN
jgi:hypothetical protein